MENKKRSAIEGSLSRDGSKERVVQLRHIEKWDETKNEKNEIKRLIKELRYVFTMIANRDYNLWDEVNKKYFDNKYPIEEFHTDLEELDIILVRLEKKVKIIK
jgi:hypothetical protein